MAESASLTTIRPSAPLELQHPALVAWGGPGYAAGDEPSAIDDHGSIVWGGDRRIESDGSLPISGQAMDDDIVGEAGQRFPDEGDTAARELRPRDGIVEGQ